MFNRILVPNLLKETLLINVCLAYLVMDHSDCIFCKIVAKTASAEVYYEDEEVMVFKDIKPAAQFHFLSIPKKHIGNVNNLNTAEDKALVEKLIECGKKVLEEKGADLENVRMGFHLPPFNSVGHLHLHVISSTLDMSFIGKLIFRPGTWWFASVDDILAKIESNIISS